jgi:UDP-N-acetylmuramoyl-tripeptide--D-alanyl-D-alanine ligase
VNGVTVLNDAYNANPNSTRAAIETLVALPNPRGRRVAVLGDMLELGDHSERYHKEMGELAATNGAGGALDLLICVGKKAQIIASSAKAAGMEGPRIVTYPDAAAAARGFLRRVRSGDLILLKGSRGIGLEAVAKAITERDKRFARKAAS